METTGPPQSVIHGHHGVAHGPGKRVPIADDHAPGCLDNAVSLVNEIDGAPKWDAALEKPMPDFGAAFVIVPAAGDAFLFLELESLVGSVGPAGGDGSEGPRGQALSVG